MFTSLMLGAALTAPGAPVPPDAVPAPTGPAPHVAFFRADNNGHVWVQVLTYTKQKVTRSISVVENGQPVVKREEVDVQVPSVSRKQLGDVVKFTTADGTALTPADAIKRVKDGVAVLVSADGKPIQKGLKTVIADTVVMSSETLAAGTIQNTAPNRRPRRRRGSSCLPLTWRASSGWPTTRTPTTTARSTTAAADSPTSTASLSRVSRSVRSVLRLCAECAGGCRTDQAAGGREVRGV